MCRVRQNKVCRTRCFSETYYRVYGCPKDMAKVPVCTCKSTYMFCFEMRGISGGFYREKKGAFALPFLRFPM